MTVAVWRAGNQTSLILEGGWLDLKVMTRNILVKNPLDFLWNSVLTYIYRTDDVPAAHVLFLCGLNKTGRAGQFPISFESRPVDT